MEKQCVGKYMLMQIVTEYKKNLKVFNFLMFYRYFSLIITSLLYWFITPNKVIYQKLIILFGLFMACGLLTFLYIRNRNHDKYKLILILIETVENSILIIISGGFASPFIWYFISTVFIAVVELSHKVAIVSAIIYFVIACISTIFRILPTENYDAITLYLNIAFSYVLVVIAILQLIQYAIQVEEKSACLTVINDELKEAKRKVEKSLKYCLDIYETVNIFSLDQDKNVLQELLHQMQHLSGAEQIILMCMTPMDKRGTFVSCGFHNKEEEEEIVELVLSSMNELPGNQEKLDLSYKKERLSVHIISYDHNPNGAIITKTDEKWLLKEAAFEEKGASPDYNSDQYQYSALSIFLKIAGMILKKLEFDEMGELLLISEEQNRIANEIHDIVLQKLFAASCKLYVLSEGRGSDTKISLKDELLGVKQSIDVTMRELREAIYGFAWEKAGEDVFRNKLAKYADEINHLHESEVSTEIVGDTQKIRANQKIGLYRVICEAVNNAIRHGKAKNIHVKVMIGDSYTTVNITDDGGGFDYNEYLKKDEKGLGLGNIHRVIELLNGHVEMNSSIAGGTEILLSIPFTPAA